MTGQSRELVDILNERLKIIQDIAAANTEHMRLNQRASGLLVLDLADERDGIDDHAHEDERARNEAALEKTMAEIRQLEETLSALDAELEATAKHEDG
ncbi:MAG: hypothetical protein R8G34_15880 [Paracoccaceae bacterium]|nr:hypothetical protein [Paracoccaceae bacterium]